MIARLAAMAILAAMPAMAHRLDEYLQATLISIEQDRVQADVRLAPGVSIFPVVLAAIDTDGDGAISAIEQHAYAERVLRDLALKVDGRPAPLRLTSIQYPRLAEMKEGLGEIQLGFEAHLPPGGSHRRLVFENHHQSRIAAYLVNCLVPRDPAIRIEAQHRNYEQSSYELAYSQPGNPSGGPLLIGLAALLLLARLAAVWRRGRPPALTTRAWVK